MANIQLGVFYIVLWAILPCRARFCLSHCCNATKIEKAGRDLADKTMIATPPPSTMKCRASSTGSNNEKSISPWRYEKDVDNSRFPSVLWQARCNCPGCIDLNSSLSLNEHREKMSFFGYSVPVMYNTTVFYRIRCKTDPDRFQLELRLYPVQVSCACLVSVKKTH